MKIENMLDISSIKSLKRYGNTIISVTKFNDILKRIYKEDNPDTNLDNEIIDNKDDNVWALKEYSNLKEKFIDILKSELGGRIILSYLPATEPAINVDCIKIEVK